MPTVFLVLIASCLLAQASTAQKFDPYELNGGLVAAVAGEDYVLIASDTRLTDGGYGVNSRRYLSGRLWSASSSTSLSTFSSVRQVRESEVDESGTASDGGNTLPWKSFPARWEPDGSLVIPSLSPLSSQSGTINFRKEQGPPISSSSFAADCGSRMQNNPPIMVGSAGCASDCESLKRRMRLELDALACSSVGPLRVQTVANLLQQVLYGRRGFPFYSFCVVAGIDQDELGRFDAQCRPGAVYVYDAIGSYERVAVASAGTGREMLQPILDRLFCETIGKSNHNELDTHHGRGRDIMAISAREQRMGVAGSLRPPVKTTVNCSWAEAVNKVACAYQSVAEREISVGDEIVICVVNSATENGEPVMDIFRFPLKKH
ncbi:hypothetical protein ACHAWF_007013 [Thalassiosira exigua]